jgi:hypothetical protein
MLQSLISSILVREPDIVIAGSVADEGPLDLAIDATRADVVIIGEQTPEMAPNYNDTLLSHPSIKLLLITHAGRDGYVYGLAPRLTPISDLSVASLLAAIRHRRDWNVTSPSGSRS